MLPLFVASPQQDDRLVEEPFEAEDEEEAIVNLRSMLAKWSVKGPKIYRTHKRIPPAPNRQWLPAICGKQTHFRQCPTLVGLLLLVFGRWAHTKLVGEFASMWGAFSGGHSQK
jgi:hypothetical protein